MNKQINEVLAYYEDEKLKLTQLVNNYILDEDYLNAHTIWKEILNVDKKLYRLYILRDEFYSEKTILRDINTIRNSIKTETPDLYAETKPLQDVEKKSSLDEILNMLFNRSIETCKVIFDKNENFYCEVRMIKKSSKLTIPNINHLLKSFWFDNYKLNEFIKLGFEFSNKTGKLIIILPCKTSDDLSNIKSLLSRIVFEIFEHNYFKNQSFIEYKIKSRR